MLRRIAFFLVGAFLSGWFVVAYATTTFPPSSWSLSRSSTCWSGTQTFQSSTFEGVRSSFMAALQSGCPTLAFTSCLSSPNIGIAYGNPGSVPACPVSGQAWMVTASCGVGGTLMAGGTTCTCPNSGVYNTVTGSCVTACPTGQTSDANGICVSSSTPSCPAAGTVKSSGFYDGGFDVSAGGPPGVACAGGCLLTFSGTFPSKTALVSGVRHYYAEGSYEYMGPDNTCTSGQGDPSSLTTAPSDTCGSDQYPRTVNGKVQCYVKTDNSPVTDPGKQTKTQTQTATNPDGSKTVTTTTTYPDGSQSKKVETYPSGTPTPSGPSDTVTTTTGSPTGQANGGGTGGGTPSNTNPTEDYCSAHPTALMCQTIQQGTPAPVQGIYTPDSSGKTFQGSIENFKAQVQAAPFYSAAMGFFNVSISAGSCSSVMTWNIPTGMGSSMLIDMTDVFCSPEASAAFSLLAIGLSLGAAWVAFRWAFI